MTMRDPRGKTFETRRHDLFPDDTPIALDDSSANLLAQRVKRDTSRERTPQREARSQIKSSPAVPKETRGARSGSEEGEIEE